MGQDVIVSARTGLARTVPVDDAVAAARAPQKTTAELAARVTLSRVQFHSALASFLSVPIDAVVDQVWTYIDTAEANLTLTAEQAAQARYFIANATEFPRVDPNPAKAALLLAVADIPGIGLSPAGVDALFIAASQT